MSVDELKKIAISQIGDARNTKELLAVLSAIKKITLIQVQKGSGK